MIIILNNESGKSFEFSCKDVNYTLKNGRITSLVFRNPSVNIPDCFTLSKIKSFEDKGNELIINCR